MSEDDYTGGQPALAPGKHRGPRFSWNQAFEATFFQSLCEAVQLGLREGTIFKPEAWDRAARTLGEKHAAFPNKNHLINKSDNARKKFRLWRGLREDPEFYYDPETRTVTASDETWRRHIEKEPLSRSLKGRPFDHEEYYEILFPDVVGSGGAPKRVTKPRRKPDQLPEADSQNNSMMDLLADVDYGAMGTSPQAPPPQLPPQQQQQLQQAQRPIPNMHQPAPLVAVQSRPSMTQMPPGQSIPMSSSNALTPPEENPTHTRKRFLHNGDTVQSNAMAQNNASPNKRQRTTTGLNKSPNTVAGMTVPPSAVPAPTIPPTAVVPTAPAVAHSSAPSATPIHAPSSSSHPADILADAIRQARARPGWSEQALDMFFRDFSDEDMDLQIKIAEKALADENKAMVFVKMPDALRRHWVARLRDAHARLGT